MGQEPIQNLRVPSEVWELSVPGPIGFHLLTLAASYLLGLPLPTYISFLIETLKTGITQLGRIKLIHSPQMLSLACSLAYPTLFLLFYIAFFKPPIPWSSFVYTCSPVHSSPSPLISLHPFLLCFRTTSKLANQLLCLSSLTRSDRHIVITNYIWPSFLIHFIMKTSYLLPSFHSLLSRPHTSQWEQQLSHVTLSLLKQQKKYNTILSRSHFCWKPSTHLAPYSDTWTANNIKTLDCSQQTLAHWIQP